MSKSVLIDQYLASTKIVLKWCFWLVVSNYFRLQFRVDPSGFGFDLVTKIPITIGTVPLRAVFQSWPNYTGSRVQNNQQENTSEGKFQVFIVHFIMSSILMIVLSVFMINQSIVFSCQFSSVRFCCSINSIVHCSSICSSISPTNTSGRIWRPSTTYLWASH